MRVRKIFLFLLLLTAALPAALGIYASTQNGGGATVSVTLPNGNTAQVSAAMATQIASRMAQSGGVFGGGNVSSFSDQAVSTSDTIAVLGSVEANQIAALNFEASGTVSEVYVHPGDYVEAGTVLARLDDTDTQVTLHQALLSLENAQINLQTLQEPPSESEIESAQLSIASAQAAYTDTANSTSDSSLQQQQIRYQEAVDAYNLAVQVRANLNADEQQTALQDAAVGAAAFNMQIAQLQLQSAQTPNDASLWQASIRIQIAQLQYDQLMAGSDTPQVANAQISVQNAQANVDSARTSLRRLDLISPISGVITAVDIQPGDTVNTGTAAVTMTDLSKLYLVASIHELDLQQVSEGTRATVILDALPNETFTATIDRISWVGESNNGIVQYSTRFLLDTDDMRIRPGMTGEADIVSGS